MRPALCEEALRLGRILAELTPKEPEFTGWSHLWKFRHRARARARAHRGNQYCFLDQNRSIWIRCSSVADLRPSSAPKSWAGHLGPMLCRPQSPLVTLGLARPKKTDWPRIAALYDALAQIAPSPVVELNRAVALSMAFGPSIGLEHLDTIASEPSLKNYHLLPSVRGDFPR